MKKNILLVLLSASLLTGCELDIRIQRLLGMVKEEPESGQKQEENNQNSHENGGNNGNSSGDQGGGNQHQQQENLEQEYSTQINTSGADFGVIAQNAGVQMDDNSYKANADKLKNYFDSKLEYKNLITNLSCTNLNTAEWKNVVYLCIGTGYYANDKFVEGILKWTSGEKIYRVEIEAMAYAKARSSDTFATDELSHVWIDTDNHSLETATTTEPTIQTFSKEYAEGVTSFAIKSTGSRVLLKSLKITWRG